MTESHDEPLKENFQLELMVFASSKFGKFNLRLKEIPPSGPLFFFKNGQINRVTNFSSTFGPTESDSEKNWVVTLILGAEIGFEIACIAYITN